MRYVSPQTEEIKVLEAIIKNSNHTIRKCSQCLLLFNKRRAATNLIVTLMLTDKDNFDT